MRVSIICLVALAALLGCRKEEGREFEVEWVTEKLVAEGYSVSPPAPDTDPRARIPEVVAAQCIDAVKASATDRICLLRCTNDRACRPTLTRRGPLGESYGEIHRGATVLVHRRCGFRDCGAAREALLDR